MRKFLRRVKNVLYDSFLFILIYEILEELLEDLIAYLISDSILYIFSKVICISVTQAIKIFVKGAIKKFVYREGDDKMKMLKNIIKNLYYNKCTIVMILLSAFSSYCAFDILKIALWLKIIICIAILSIGILCSVNIGWETLNEIDERTKVSREKREAKEQERAVKKAEKLKAKELDKIISDLKEEEEKHIREQSEKQMKNFELGVKEIALKKYEELHSKPEVAVESQENNQEIKNETAIEAPQGEMVKPE